MGVNVMGGPPFPLDSHKKGSDFQICSKIKHRSAQAATIQSALLTVARLHATVFAPPYLNHHGVEQEAGHCLCSAHLLAKVGSVE
jgi:hypothetical protein